jgi:hypothetical protein
MQPDKSEQCQARVAMRTCVHPEGRFQVAHHRASYTVVNLRPHRWVQELGRFEDERSITNHENFPQGSVMGHEADGVYEIANPFPFRGATYIGKAWADAKRQDPTAICLPPPPPLSMSQWCRKHLAGDSAVANPDMDWLKTMPEAVQLALAVNSTDPEDLISLAEAAGAFLYDTNSGNPVGLRYVTGSNGAAQPLIHNPVLFEAVANNPNLPDVYKDVMVLRPGAQGESAIVGGWQSERGSHVFEYLRNNSYIPGGHYAANMANDAIRYTLDTLTFDDMVGMRHLYYQRTFVRLAAMAGLNADFEQRALSVDELEALRYRILALFENPSTRHSIPVNGGLWGWNFGFDYSPSHYRLHASHQQIHQQYALIPKHARRVASLVDLDVMLPAYACGDQIHDFILTYQEATGADFFTAYIDAVLQNKRTDGRTDGERDLVIYHDANVIAFVPKAQTSQWELQILPLKPVGNVLEADGTTRVSLDRALWTALRTLGNMGARMVTTIEYGKRFDAGATGQRLLYSILPRLPESPGAFSEAQLRWICGHYPEDFAAVCRTHRPSNSPP